MKKETIYRKVDATAFFPKKEGNYHVIFFGGTEYESMATVTYDDKFGFHEEMTDCTGITHWLEEMELPSEEDITAKANVFFPKDTLSDHIQRRVFKSGAKYIIDMITKTTK